MEAFEPALEAARRGDHQAFADLIAPFRRELRALCYRMAGSIHDVDDLFQDAMLRAWRGLAGFQGRSTLRTWLYKVTTSACLDALDRKAPRARPIDLGPAAALGAPLAMRHEPIWIEPCPEELVDAAPSPEARYTSQESVSLAFLALLQLLPPKQRVVVVLRDVLGWEASECAELLETSVASVTSALQRGRETLATRPAATPPPPSASTAELLARYVRAWESVDVAALVALLGEDASLSMPPITSWLQGRAAIGGALGAMILTPAALGNLRLVPLRASGQPAFAGYQRDASGVLAAAALHLLTIAGDHIVAIDAFLDPSLFARFDLPLTIAG